MSGLTHFQTLASVALTLAGQNPISPQALGSFIANLDPSLMETALIREMDSGQLARRALELKQLEKEGPVSAIPPLLRELSDSLNRLYKKLKSVQNGVKVSPAEDHSPSVVNLKDIEFVVEDGLDIPERLMPLYHGLSLNAVRGLYVLHTEGVSRETLLRFLENEGTEIAGGPNTILDTIAVLYDLGVVGFADAFKQTPHYAVVANYLSDEPRFIRAQWTEHLEAVRIAGHPDAHGALLGVRMDIDWSQLPTRQRFWVERIMSRLLPANRIAMEKRLYQKQKSTTVDIVVQTREGKLRLVEVKSSQYKTIHLSDENNYFFALQLFRHALLQRQHPLDGIEIHLAAKSISPTLYYLLKEVSRLIEVPMVVTLGENDHRKRILGSLTPLPRQSLKSVHPPKRELMTNL